MLSKKVIHTHSKKAQVGMEQVGVVTRIIPEPVGGDTVERIQQNGLRAMTEAMQGF